MQILAIEHSMPHAADCRYGGLHLQVAVIQMKFVAVGKSYEANNFMIIIRFVRNLVFKNQGIEEENDEKRRT